MTAERARLVSEIAAMTERVAAAEQRLATVSGGQHDCEKTIVRLEAQTSQANDERERLRRRLELVFTEHSRAAEERQTVSDRQEEAARAIVLHESQQREAEASLSSIVGRLQTARDRAESCLRLVNESRTEQAGLVERAAALDADVSRLEAAALELEERLAGRKAELDRNDTRRHDVQQSMADAARLLDEDVVTLDALKVEVRAVDEEVSALRNEFTERDHGLKAARHALDGVRTQVMQAELRRAQAASDSAHLAMACLDTTGVPLDEVIGAVERMEDAGELVGPARRASALPDEDGESEDEAEGAGTPEPLDVSASSQIDPDEVIAILKKRLDRLGAVNMMAIEQFDELETRHTFLTTQRKDLLDSIALTGEAIHKIDKTTRERFAETFELINRNFEQTFTTLFGGGRAGLVLIDQENETESGIDIIAQPPGKRLQNVQLLSGGEKALTAMALMFAIFKHRPSPFCLLDEIDAPLDDANIGRFVEMLQGMQEHTQFILVTHNRKTMEIANRLYGVTMEEPGVSKLISIQLN
jgi:chromosome segregation protein